MNDGNGRQYDFLISISISQFLLFEKKERFSCFLSPVSRFPVLELK